VGATLEEGQCPVVLDMEASVEHMRRNTVRHIDTLLIVVEPYYRALEAAARLFRLAGEIPIENVYAIANKVRNKAEESAIRTFCDQRRIPVLVVIPYDEAVGRADLIGKALIDAEPTAPAVHAIEQLVAEVFA
jgi:CO dehydrogenase maturation factor